MRAQQVLSYHLIYIYYVCPHAAKFSWQAKKLKSNMQTEFKSCILQTALIFGFKLKAKATNIQI